MVRIIFVGGCMKRKIIHIDDEKCNGCGECIPNCPEGALQMIDGKARLVSDLFCDGLGACIGECPVGAITVEEREAEPYNEKKVMENIIRQGESVIKAHLEHLADHNETELLKEAVTLLEEKGIEVDFKMKEEEHHFAGCPGAQAVEFDSSQSQSEAGPSRPSALRQWPVQMHLLPPSAPYFKDSDLLLAADCAGFAAGDFHKDYLKGKRLAIACPKLDSNQDIYLDKLTALIDFAGIKSITVLTVEVPCCRGLLQLARKAAASAEKSVPVNWIEISIRGEVLQETAVV